MHTAIEMVLGLIEGAVIAGVICAIFVWAGAATGSF